MNAAKLTAENLQPVLLRGTRRGLEILIDGDLDAAAIAGMLEERLAEAPGFFAGSEVTVAVSGTLPPGSLTVLDALTARFGLRIAEVRSTANAVDAVPVPVDSDAIPLPIDDGLSAPASTRNFTSQPIESAAHVASGSAPNLASADAPKLCVGPVRSGVVLDAPGHLVIVGDVNPGAEIRAAGCIVVLGALRGTAHAGYGQNAGFILALKLLPQQLRIAGRIARAGDGEAPPENAEIAYVKNGRIVVDAYKGRLPSGAIAAQS